MSTQSSFRTRSILLIIVVALLLRVGMQPVVVALPLTKQARAQREYARVFGESWRALDAPDCPLTPEEREQAKRNRVYHLAKRTAQDLRRGRWTAVRTRLRTSGLSLSDWLTYLRRPRRDQLAGTPVDANGDYVIPRSLVG